MNTTTKPERLDDGDTFELDGLSFRVSIQPDPDMGPPWEEHDGHGIVSEWRRETEWHNARATFSKAPGERMLCRDGRSARFYDFAATMRKARKDGWGLGAEDITKLRAKLGREPTGGDVTAAAVERDFQFLKDWCEDRWSWVYVQVTLLDLDGNETPQSESLGGIESDAGDYLTEVAHDLAGQLATANPGERAKTKAGQRIREGTELVGYGIESEDLSKLRAMAARLCAGSDKMRDEGNLLMALIWRIEANSLEAPHAA